jgi:hypothetical protein
MLGALFTRTLPDNGLRSVPTARRPARVALLVPVSAAAYNNQSSGYRAHHSQTSYNRQWHGWMAFSSHFSSITIARTGLGKYFKTKVPLSALVLSWFSAVLPHEVFDKTHRLLILDVGVYGVED